MNHMNVSFVKSALRFIAGGALISGSLLLKRAARMHAEGELERAKTNVMVYMNQSVGIGEHSDIVEAIQEELDKMAMASDRIDMLEKYFPL